MSCSYADIAMTKHDSFADRFYLKLSVWKRFRDDVLVLWKRSTVSFSFFFRLIEYYG